MIPASTNRLPIWILDAMTCSFAALVGVFFPSFQQVKTCESRFIHGRLPFWLIKKSQKCANANYL
jgi:hypothetical protein